MLTLSDMKKILFLLFLPFLLCTGARARTYRELLQDDFSRAAWVYHIYEAPDAGPGKAPQGFKPFYISHYGRHGSRYHTSAGFFDRCIPDLCRADSLGLLTDDGKRLLNHLEELKKAHEGMYGFLTRVGAAQHREIAQRMYDNFPEVFNRKDRPEVRCISSPIQRCIQSMANFCVSLGSNAGGLSFTLDAGDKYYGCLAQQPLGAAFDRRASAITDSIILATFDAARLMAKTFTDTSAAHKILGREPALFFNAVFTCAAITANLEADLEDFLPYFNFEEALLMSSAENCRLYAYFFDSPEFPEQIDNLGRAILRDIVEKADAAVAGNGVAADLRFGHDSGLSPLLGFLGVDGNDWTGPIDRSADHWFCCREMCMASNLQMIFYRNRSGEVLVRLLKNEREATIPALTAAEGGFYRWQDLRAHFAELLR